jgi:DNA-binding response OmpR family regulator
MIATEQTVTQLAEIMLIDDDLILLNEMSENFQENGIACRVSSNWNDALQMLNGWRPDLIVLDQRLGAVDTLLLLPTIRQMTSAPILFLTGSRSEADRVIGLELGADDFLLKPISGRELVARVRAHLRRSHSTVATTASNGHEAGGQGDWEILRAERRVMRPDGTVVPLTSTEFELLITLVASQGTPIDRDTLSRKVLHRPALAEDRALDNLVHHIRRKFGVCGAHEIIVSVRNVGYVFRGYPKD